MGTALDPLSAPLNVRRPAAPTLPSFELPPPPFNLAAAAPKFPAQSSHPPISHPSNVSVGNLLTPPATIQSGEHATPQPLAPSTGSDLPPTYWPASSYGHAWGSTVNAYPARTSFSPSSGMQVRSTVTSPPSTDGLPHPYEAPSVSYQSYQALPAPSTMPPATPLGYPRQPWPSYSLPAMNGPVMTNVHSPGGPMSMMGGMQPGLLPGFNSGHVASSQHLYGSHAPPHGMSAPAADRPFKCDQCPQSFNRNHDLKRHKRIHLAVKPFPCAHCDKSFSRKDALKRHILVKGCGKDGDDAGSSQTGVDIKGEGRSEDGSPLLNGR
ncbi:unnamed protein product [Penicillium salamii]|nr:unnamed protein product [Penicillium salamii]